MDPLLAHKTWRTVEPLHGVVYLAPEQQAAYEAVGVGGVGGYFASRSAAMGAVAPEVVVATFFNFQPDLVRGALDGVWDRTTPSAVLDARLGLVDAILRRLLPDALGHPDLAEAADLARTAAEMAAEHPEGRPLFAAHAALAWPEDPHLVLWHAQTLLREFRGDGHVAALTAAGVRGCEALALHAATGELPRAVLQGTRAWSDAEWDAAVGSLAERGWLDDEGAFTPEGRAARTEIEHRTDELAVAAYAPLGEAGCQRLRELARPWSRAVVASGELGPMSAARAADGSEPPAP